MPPTFTLGLGEDLWLPIDLAEDLAAPIRARKQHYLNVIGRLADGVSLAAARAEMDQLGTSLQAEHPEANTGRRPLLLPLHAARTGELRAPLLLLQGAAALVLLIACANLANLTLARTLGRSHELAVRTALGSRRARLVRQLLTESVVVSVAGGGLGVLIAIFGTSALLVIDADVLPAIFSVRADGRVLLFGLALSVLTGVAFGMLPAARAADASVSGFIREGGRGTTGGRSATRIRNALVVVQVGLAVVLLVGAALLVQSFRQLTSVRSGFDAENVLTAQLGLGGARYEEATAVNRFYNGVLDALAASPAWSRLARRSQYLSTAPSPAPSASMASRSTPCVHRRSAMSWCGVTTSRRCVCHWSLGGCSTTPTDRTDRRL